VDDKLKFAVFIDFDNIEIGVKSTLHREFDVKCVLEGIKDRGEIAAKIAYGNWSRHAADTRALTEQGVQMVQRDTSPRGDKNGADINLALDALEMAFTRDHINAFAIVSGDSDFMALVNKLKQYNKRVYIVGGKAFTSTILQRNCHEFISYESLTEGAARPRKQNGGGSRSRRHALPISRAVPLLNRALNTLESRGVQPQLGLLKSNMLQLEPTFSERDYGVSSFSDFIRKLADEGVLTLKTVDGHYVVERRQEAEEISEEASTDQEDPIPLLKEVLLHNIDLLEFGLPAREIRALVRAAQPDFDETDYGFQEFAELLNLARDKGLVRVEADPEHGIRCYPSDDLLEELQRAKEESEAPQPGGPPDEQEESAKAETAAPKRSRRKTARKRRSRRTASAQTGGREALSESAGPQLEEAAAPQEAAPAAEAGSSGEEGESAESAAADPDGAASQPQDEEQPGKTRSSSGGRKKTSRKTSSRSRRSSSRRKKSSGAPDSDTGPS